MKRPDLTPAAERRMARRANRRRRGAPEIDEVPATRTLLERKNNRTDAPLVWPRAGQFSKHSKDLSQVDVVRIAKNCELLDELRQRTDYNFGGGRPRIRGEWVLAFLAFVQSGKADIQPWWRDSSSDMWWEAGFSGRPSYETTRNRFKELEEVGQEELFDASAVLIRRAIERSGNKACFDLHIDCTEAETNARMHHDCRSGEGCPGYGLQRRDRHGKPIRAKNGDAIMPDRIATEEVSAQRRKRATEPLDENGDPIDGPVERLIYDDTTGTLRMRVGKHWWRVMDPTAGPRAYKGPKGAVKFWLGFYNLKVVCHTFAEPIVNLVESADEQECHLLPEALERVLEICGENHVRSLSADKGFPTRENCQLLVDHGITPVMPHRRYRGEEDRPQDFERFDRDGVPRCQFCGGESEFVRFASKPKARIWFRCKRPRPECLKPLTSDDRNQVPLPKEQTILCSTDPRYLIPLWRNTAAYQTLDKHGLPLERAHSLARMRNANGGKNHASRPKRIGRDWQQLRAHGSVLVNWMKILWIQGWIDGAVCRNEEQPYFEDGAEFLKVMKAHRRAEGLERPYGPKAVENETGPEFPRYRHIIDPDTTYLAIDVDNGHVVDMRTGEIVNDENNISELPDQKLTEAGPDDEDDGDARDGPPDDGEPPGDPPLAAP